MTVISEKIKNWKEMRKKISKIFINLCNKEKD